MSVSIIIPTYNESENILKLIEAIKYNMKSHSSTVYTEIIVVDDNSPDGTGKIVEDYIQNKNNNNNNKNMMIGQDQSQFRKVGQKDNNNFRFYNNNNNEKYSVRVIHRSKKSGLISAILKGIESSTGENILIMDADFSHPPETIPTMVDKLLEDPNCIVVASRYINGGSIVGWPYKRRILSGGAAKLARHGLKVRHVKDPMSGFFAFPRYVIKNLKIDTKGYKLLLEVLVKSKGTAVKEIPYTFTDRKSGQSKLDNDVIIDYAKAVWHLYRYGQKNSMKAAAREKKKEEQHEKRKSVLFLSKAGRFYTVGASGLIVNYLISIILSNGMLSKFWYLQATFIGIIFSITTNFILNKIWTFEDRNFSVKTTLKQYALFVAISGVGAAIQLALLYLFVQDGGFQYAVSLIMAVAIASISNFLLNKKWTFGEKVWG
jgi:dolichol-phosphate mannosyltransferase